MADNETPKTPTTPTTPEPSDTDKTTKRLNDQNKILKELRRTQAEFLEDQLRLNERLTEEQKKLLDSKEQALAINADLLKARRTQLSVLEVATEEELKQLGLFKEGLETKEKLIERQKQLIKALEGSAEAADKLNKGISAADAAANQLLRRMFGVTRASKEMGEALKNPRRSLKMMQARLKENLTATNLMGSAALKVAEGFKKAADQVKQTYGIMATLKKGKEFYDQSRLISRQVGVLSADELSEFQSRMTGLSDATRFTRAEMMKTHQELFKASNAYREMSKKDQGATIELSKTLERRLGVAATTSGAAVNNLVQIFGKTPAAANKMTASMAVAAKTMKLDVSKAMADFASQSNNLAKFGLPDVENEFLRLAKVQQQTGISMDSMISSMEKFTTFEGALTAATKMNAVFGSTIDGLELMDTVMEEGPLKGFLKLRKEMEANGIQMDKLSFAQMRSLKESIGLTEQQIKQFGGISVEELEKIASETYSVTDASKQLQDGQKNGETSTESLAIAQDNLAKSLQWVADGIEKVKKWANDLIGSLGAFGPLLASGGAVIGGLVLLAGTLKGIGNLFTSVGGTAPAAAGGINKIGAAASKQASMVGRFAKGLGGLTIAAAGVGVGREMYKKGWKKTGVAVGAGSAALGGAMVGSAILPGVGTVVGGVIGGIGGGIASMFEGEQNYLSKPTYATVGEKPELVSKRTQKLLPTASKVSGAPGSTDLKLTVNMMAKDGTILDKKVVNQTLESDIEKTVNHMIDEKFNLIFG